MSQTSSPARASENKRVLRYRPKTCPLPLTRISLTTKEAFKKTGSRPSPLQ